MAGNTVIQRLQVKLAPWENAFVIHSVKEGARSQKPKVVVKCFGYKRSYYKYRRHGIEGAERKTAILDSE